MRVTTGRNAGVTMKFGGGEKCSVSTCAAGTCSRATVAELPLFDCANAETLRASATNVADASTNSRCAAATITHKTFAPPPPFTTTHLPPVRRRAAAPVNRGLTGPGC
jgi:hypothetical protein